MSEQDFNTELAMLQGNINRMSVTKNITELNDMWIFAIERLKKVYEHRYEQLSN